MGSSIPDSCSLVQAYISWLLTLAEMRHESRSKRQRVTSDGNGVGGRPIRVVSDDGEISDFGAGGAWRGDLAAQQGGGDHHQQSVDRLTEDFLRGAEGEKCSNSDKFLLLQRPDSGPASLLKGLFASNLKSVKENVEKFVAKRERDMNLFFEEKEDKISNLSKDLKDKEDKVSSLTRALKVKEDKVCSLTKVLKDKEDKVSCLTKALQDKEDQVSSLTKGLKDKEGKVSNLTKELLETEERNCELEKHVADVESSKAQMKVEIEDEKSNTLSFSKLYHASTLEVGCLKKELQRMTENCKALSSEKENDLQVKDDVIAQLTKQLKEKDDTIYEQQNQIATLDKTRSSSTKKFSDLKIEKEREIGEAKREILELKSALKSKDSEIEIMKRERENEIELLRSENDEVRNDKDCEIEVLKNDKDSEIEALRREIAQIEQLKKELQILRTRERDRIEKFKADDNSIKTLQQELNTKQKEIEDLKNDRKKEIETLKVEKDKAIKEVDILIVEKTNQMEELERVKEKELEKLRSEKAELISEQENKNQEFSEMSNKLLRTITNFKNDKEKQANSISVLVKQKAAIQELLVGCQTREEQQRAEIERIKDETDSRNRSEELLLDKIGKLESQKKNLQTEIRTLGHKSSNLRRKLHRQANHSKDTLDKNRKAFSRLIFNLRTKLQSQVLKTKSLNTQMKSTVFFLEKTKRDLRYQQEKLDDLKSKNRTLQEINQDLFSKSSHGKIFAKKDDSRIKEESVPPVASGSKKGEKVVERKDIKDTESSLEMFELANAAEEHSMEITYNILDPTGRQDLVLVEVVLRGGFGDCKRFVSPISSCHDQDQLG